MSPFVGKRLSLVLKVTFPFDTCLRKWGRLSVTCLEYCATACFVFSWYDVGLSISWWASWFGRNRKTRSGLISVRFLSLCSFLLPSTFYHRTGSSNPLVWTAWTLMSGEMCHSWPWHSTLSNLAASSTIGSANFLFLGPRMFRSSSISTPSENPPFSW